MQTDGHCASIAISLHPINMHDIRNTHCQYFASQPSGQRLVDFQIKSLIDLLKAHTPFQKMNSQTGRLDRVGMLHCGVFLMNGPIGNWIARSHKPECKLAVLHNFAAFMSCQTIEVSLFALAIGDMTNYIEAANYIYIMSLTVLTRCHGALFGVTVVFTGNLSIP